jgi:hypothetical protein
MSARITYVMPGGHTIARDCDEDIKSIFAVLGEMNEVLGVTRCGNPSCKGDTPPGFRQREAKGFTFYEAECPTCRWRLQFGQKKEGGLFPKDWEPPFKGRNADGQEPPPRSDGPPPPGDGDIF